VQLLQDPFFQVFRPFPEGGMRLLAAVRVDLLVSSDLLNQVGQEERANMGRQRSGRGARYEVLETGKQARRRGLFGRRFLGHAERSPTQGRVERTEGSGPCRLLMSRDATRRQHEDTSMHLPIRYTFYQRARREQEGPTRLRLPLL